MQYGTRNLALSVSAVNLGSAQALHAGAGAAGHLPPGLEMNQDVLATLLRGNTALGAPALESLILNANESINVYGAVALDARGAGGAAAAAGAGAPAIYGYGAAGDTATIAAGEFIWAGAIAADRNGINVGATKPQAPGGAMLDQLGHGKLNVVADTIRLESSPYQLPNDLVTAERLLLGFSSVTLDAAKMIAGRARGGLSVYHEQDGYNAQDGWRYRGGDLLIRTPLLTGEAGSVMTVKAGGALSVAGTGAPRRARRAGRHHQPGRPQRVAGHDGGAAFGKAVDQGRRQHRAGRGFAHRPGRPRGASVRPAALQLGRRPGTAEHGRRYHAGQGRAHRRVGAQQPRRRVQAIALGDSAGRIDLAAPCAPRPPAAMTRAARWCRMKAAKPCCARRWPTSAS